MRHIENLKKAAEIVGLSPWELRTGAISGKYPAMRIGGPHGRIVFDIDMLNARIGKLMEANMKPTEYEYSSTSPMLRIAK